MRGTWKTFQILVTFLETGTRMGLNCSFSESDPTPEEVDARVRSLVTVDSASYRYFVHQIDASATDAAEWRARWA